MAILLNVIESTKQIIAEIPEYLSISISGVVNAMVYYTLDGTAPDTTGASLTTYIMEHAPGDPLNGTIFLPTTANLLELNMLAVGVSPDDTTVFYRRYGLDQRKIGIGRPGIKKIIAGGSSYTNTPSPNLTTNGMVIANDGYTEGYAVAYNFTEDGYDGYVSSYNVAFSGQLTDIPLGVFDHIIGYTTDDNGDVDGYSTTTLTPGQELGLLKLSNKSPYTDRQNIDPRSSTIVDSDGDQLEVIPVEDYPEIGYQVDGYTIDDDFDNAPEQATTAFTSGGIFDPRASYIEMDGRVDGYINGQPILPGDRVIINKPYGELRYSLKREDGGDAIRKTLGYISGGLVCPIYDYAKNQAAFYYWDSHDNRWLVSLQTITPPKYEIFAKRNGVVVGQVFPWVIGKRQVMPG